jgi:hypothetical protein
VSSAAAGRAGHGRLPAALDRLECEAAPERRRATQLTIHGQLRIDEVVDLMVKAGGFERNGARVVLAVTLGFLPGRLPESFPIALHADGCAL